MFLTQNILNSFVFLNVPNLNPISLHNVSPTIALGRLKERRERKKNGYLPNLCAFCSFKLNVESLLHFAFIQIMVVSLFSSALCDSPRAGLSTSKHTHRAEQRRTEQMTDR